MGVTITPLGFRKPDGNEPLRNGDNEIAANAQKAEEVLSPALTRIRNLESAVLSTGGPLLIEDPEDPGFYVAVVAE